jgi:hypothetical protein
MRVLPAVLAVLLTLGCGDKKTEAGDGGVPSPVDAGGDLPDGSAGAADGGGWAPDASVAPDAGPVDAGEPPGWEVVPSNATEWLQGITGFALDDVWAVGLKSSAAPRTVLLHWDGVSWNPALYQPASNLLTVWGSTGQDVWAGGMGGTLLHHDGNAWTAVSSGPGFSIYGLFGFSSQDVWAVGTGGGTSHFTGTWNDVAGTDPGDWLWAAWGADPQDVWVAGHEGNGQEARIYRWQGSALSGVTPPAGAKGLWSLWGTSSSDVWACGKERTVLHFDGQAWSADTNVPAGPETLHGGWASSPDNMWVVGQEGLVLHRDASGWHDKSPGVAQNLWGVWGTGTTVWVVGRDGLILRRG